MRARTLAGFDEVGRFEVVVVTYLLGNDRGLLRKPLHGSEVVVSALPWLQDLCPLVSLKRDGFVFVVELVVHRCVRCGVDDLDVDQPLPVFVAAGAANFDRDALLGFAGRGLGLDLGHYDREDDGCACKACDSGEFQWGSLVRDICAG